VVGKTAFVLSMRGWSCSGFVKSPESESKKMRDGDGHVKYLERK
jgi:hypothetical protein